MLTIGHLKNKLPLKKPSYMRWTVILLVVLASTLLLVNALTLAQPVAAANESLPDYPYWEDDLQLQDIFNVDQQAPCCDFGSDRPGSNELHVEGTYDFLASDGAELLVYFDQLFELEFLSEYNAYVEEVTYLLTSREFQVDGGYYVCHEECTIEICNPEDPTECYCSHWETICDAPEQVREFIADPSFEMIGGGWELTDDGRLIVREALAPACVLPQAGMWQVTSSCWIHAVSSVPGDVIVGEDVSLTVAPGINFNIDFANHSLRIKPGGKVLIKPGGKIE